MEKQYKTLKVEEFFLDPLTMTSQISFLFNKDYLFTGFILPESDLETETKLNKLNSYPYELAVQRFLNTDTIFNANQTRPSENRIFEGMGILISQSIRGSKIPLFITYLTFD